MFSDGGGFIAVVRLCVSPCGPPRAALPRGSAGDKIDFDHHVLVVGLRGMPRRCVACFHSLVDGAFFHVVGDKHVRHDAGKY